MYKLLPVVREWRGEFTVGKMEGDVFVPICICENKKQADDLCQETIEEMLK